jgi:hypothetical protein
MHKDEYPYVSYRGVEVPADFASVQPSDNEAKGLEAFMDGVDAVMDMMPQKVILGGVPLTPTGEKLTDLQHRNTRQGNSLVWNGNQPSEGAI